MDLAVLREIVKQSYRTLTSGIFGHRAREGGLAGSRRQVMPG